MFCFSKTVLKASPTHPIKAHKMLPAPGVTACQLEIWFGDDNRILEDQNL
jgi:hypothetical protein